jgi:hypothetical protein
MTDKYCYDCKHCFQYKELPFPARCIHPGNTSDPDYVTGIRNSIHSLREFRKLVCGIENPKYFEILLEQDK